jgi:hypothetical protein
MDCLTGQSIFFYALIGDLPPISGVKPHMTTWLASKMLPHLRLMGNQGAAYCSKWVICAP